MTGSAKRPSPARACLLVVLVALLGTIGGVERASAHVLELPDVPALPDVGAPSVPDVAEQLPLPEVELPSILPPSDDQPAPQQPTVTTKPAALPSSPSTEQAPAARRATPERESGTGSRRERPPLRHERVAAEPQAASREGASERPAPASSGEASKAGSESGGAGGLGAIGRELPLPLPVPDWSKPIILVLILVALWMGIRSRRAATRARRLELQRAELAEDVDAMQAALVPAVPARLGGVAISVAYRPADGPAAGGDFYDVFQFGDDRVAVILGDVSGHGRDAIAQAAQMRYTLRAYVEAGLEPRIALKLAGEVQAPGAEGAFTTVAIGVHDAGNGTLTYATAGHDSPLLPGGREPLPMSSSAALGWGLATGQRQTTVSLPENALACFFTDGLSEARCPGGFLGRGRLKAILGELGAAASAGALLDRVLAAADDVRDDMAAVIVRAETAAGADPLWVEELELDARRLAGDEPRRLLEAFSLPAAEIDRVLSHAHGVVADRGGAVLRARLSAGAPSVSVTAASPGAPVPLSRAAGVARLPRPSEVPPPRGEPIALGADALQAL